MSTERDRFEIWMREDDSGSFWECWQAALEKLAVPTQPAMSDAELAALVYKHMGRLDDPLRSEVFGLVKAVLAAAQEKS